MQTHMENLFLTIKITSLYIPIEAFYPLSLASPLCAETNVTFMWWNFSINKIYACVAEKNFIFCVKTCEIKVSHWIVPRTREEGLVGVSEANDGLFFGSIKKMLLREKLLRWIKSHACSLMRVITLMNPFKRK